MHRITAALAFMVLIAYPRGIRAEEASRFRLPAPAEDDGELLAEPVFGQAAGQPDTDATLQPMEWVAKRTWHTLNLPWNRKDSAGPPALKAELRDGWLCIEATVVDGGVPLRNQVFSAEVEQIEGPVLILLRSADAFGELLVEIDCLAGTAITRSVTVSRSMIGGQSHSSPMPEQAFSRTIGRHSFAPLEQGSTRLTVRAQGAQVRVSAGDRELFSFQDPDPAGGKLGFGSAGRLRVRNVQQWELITPRERQRREGCLRDMHEFCRRIDSFYDADVRGRNRVDRDAGGLRWTWPRTGASASFRADGPGVHGEIRAGLYGNDLLVEGLLPDIRATGMDGRQYEPDPGATAQMEGNAAGILFTLPLRARDGRTAIARARAAMTVQTVWFWTVTVEGEPMRVIRAGIDLAPAFAVTTTAGQSSWAPAPGLPVMKGRELLRQNGKAGLFVKAIEPDNSVLFARPNGGLGIATTDPRLRFATVILPAQPFNLVGFRHRMVHFIRYPEGPVQHWRRVPSFQEYPDNVDLARFSGNGADAMVWHHTWANSDFRDREGFLVNAPEMKRAMDETHRLGMKAICYLGLVPGRSPLLRFEDLSPQRGRYGGYEKNWDLQDQTFYHVAGRYPEFLAWMTDYWCKTYGIDGFYLDGGSFGTLAWGPGRHPLHPEDKGLSLDELRHRAYYRIRKVLELNRAGYGLEPWSGLDWMINGFYDCMMIGESFQEAAPEYYRDGHNALLTGCCVKMYGMRESSQNPYNIAMAAVNLSDIQVCSGNGAWGDDPDTADTWNRVRPLWALLNGIDWDRLVEARPWYAQELFRGRGFYAANYSLADRVIILLANRTEQAGTFEVSVDTTRLSPGSWKVSYCLGKSGDVGPLGDGRIVVALPALHDGPVGLELRRQ
jgi:hypothetical protein